MTTAERTKALELLNYIRLYPDHLAVCVSRRDELAQWCDCGYERCRQCYFELKALLEAA